MITINPKKVGLVFLFAVVVPAIIAFIFFTRFNYVPVQITIGSCTMDYTAKPTYEERLSSLESHDFKVKGWEMLMCYGAPQLRGRDMLGDRVPFDELWRFGANEPTRFYTTADIEMAGLYMPKGRYSIYAIPGRFEWEIFISESISHWGNDISPEVRAKEIGSFKLEPKYIADPVEQFLVHTELPEIESNEIMMFIDWQQTRLEIPIINLEEKDKVDRSLKGLIKRYSQEAEESKDKVDPILEVPNN